MSKTLKKQLLKEGVPAHYININKKTQNTINIPRILITPITNKPPEVTVTPIETFEPEVEIFPIGEQPSNLIDDLSNVLENKTKIEIHPIQTDDSGVILTIALFVIGFFAAFSGGVPSGAIG